jgi:hypothetical protein
MVIICVINYVRSMLYTFQMARTPFLSYSRDIYEIHIGKNLSSFLLFVHFVREWKKGKSNMKMRFFIFLCVPNHVKAEFFQSYLKAR